MGPPLRDTIRSIAEFEAAYGSPAMGRLAYGNNGLRTFGSRSKKLLTTGDSGTFQRIVGPQLWANVNTERSLFAGMRKKEWTETGVRVITAYPGTKIAGVPEATSPVAAGGTVEPAFAQYFPSIKIMETAFDQSLISKFHGQIAEAVTWEQFRDFMGITHGKGINETLNANPVTAVAGDNFESVYRVTGSFAEIAATGAAAGRYDIYGLDRDAGATFADAQLLHNSGTDRDLTLRLLNSLIRVTQVGSGDYNPENYWFYTGPDTWQTWGELLQPQQRFDEKEGTFSPLNGVQLGMAGNKGPSYRMAAYQGVPIVVSNDALKDTISQVLMLHRDHLWYQVAQPTVYREVGISTGQEQLTASYADKGLFYTVGEPVTNFFGANGKLIDLK